MSSPQDSFTSSTTSQNTDFDDHQSLLTRLNLLLPTADNKHIAFRFLLDAALHVRLSQPTDRVILSTLVKGNVTPLRIAKLNLLKMLNSAWHPILDECEQLLEPHLNSFPNITFPESSETATSYEMDYPALPSQTIDLSHGQQSPPSAELLGLTMENNLSFSLGYDCSNDDLRSSPVHIYSCAARLESGVEYRNTTPSAPLAGSSAARSTGVEVGKSIPAGSSEDCEVPYVSAMHEYMIAPARSSPIYRTLPGECSNTTSRYSSLLPESHCPPFAKINHSSLGCGLPSESPDAITSPSELSAALGSNEFLPPGMTDTPWWTNHAPPDPCHLHGYPTFSYESNSVAVPSVAFAGGLMAQEEGIGRTVNDQAYLSALPSISPLSQATSVCDNSSLPGGSNTSPGGPGEQSTDAARARKKKRAKRVFERPPGLPLGPWTSSEMGPLPETVKKPRKVRRAPTNQHRSSSQQGLSEKVSCPKCSTIVLAKSLTRHLERHYNWEEGEYSAHLYCRYCFAPYSRMDLLIRHQKTDAQCVMHQYDIYWSGRQPYLEQQIQIWRENAERTRASTL